MARRGELLGGLVVSQTRGYSQHVCRVGTVALRLGNVRLGLVDVRQQEVGGSVRREDGRSAARGELVQLLVKVVGLVQGAGSLAASAKSQRATHSLETDPRLDGLDEGRVVANLLGGVVSRLGEIAAVEREKELDEERNAEMSAA